MAERNFPIEAVLPSSDSGTALENSKHWLLGQTAEQSEVGMALMDLDGNLVCVNSAFAEAHGRTVEDLSGRHIAHLHQPEEMLTLAAAHRNVKATGSYSGELRRVKKSGEYLHVIFRLSLMKDEQQAPIGIIETLQDISFFQWSEDLLRAARDQLEHKVEERTAELKISNAKLLDEIAERNRAEAQIAYRDRLLRSVAACAQCLLCSKGSEAPIPDTLEKLATAIDVHRAMLLQKMGSGEGPGSFLAPRAAWLDKCAFDLAHGPKDELEPVFWFDRWRELLEAGEPAHGPVRNLPHEERQALRTHGISSVLALPVVTESGFWGLIRFDDCLKPREWTSSEISILKTAAASIGGYLQREAVAKQLAEARDELEQRVRQRTAELSWANEKLQAEIGVRQEAEKRITASLVEKEILLREVHHRVKNNLQIISSLVKLQARRVKNDAHLAAIQDTETRIMSMATAHEILYQSKRLDRINAGQYLRSIARSLSRAYPRPARGTRLAFDVEDAAMGIDVAVPCGIIVSELVSNAFKHTFHGDREGEVALQLKSLEGSRFRLSVSDNGIGDADGAQSHDGDSLGLRLVNLLAEQLGGKMTMEENEWTRFTIEFSDQSSNRKE